MLCKIGLTFIKCLVGLLFHINHGRETLLGQLTVQIREAEDDFQKKTGQRAGGKGIPKGKNLPEVVNAVVFVRQTEARVRQ